MTAFFREALHGLERPVLKGTSEIYREGGGQSLTEVSDVQKYYLLGFLFFTMLMEQGCSLSNKVERNPAMMVGLIGRKGEAILFIKSMIKLL